jgi:hypothetical protein
MNRRGIHDFIIKNYPDLVPDERPAGCSYYYRKIEKGRNSTRVLRINDAPGSEGVRMKRAVTARLEGDRQDFLFVGVEPELRTIVDEEIASYLRSGASSEPSGQDNNNDVKINGGLSEPSPAEVASLLAECLENIQIPDVRHAFQYVVDRCSALEGYDCYPKKQGYFLTFRLYRNGKWPFAFIVNKGSLLFYFRKPSFLPPWSYKRAQILSSFPKALESDAGHITYRVESFSDATRLLDFLHVI